MVSCEAIEKSAKLYTYGVGSHWQFEKDYIFRYPNKVVHMYDHTVDVVDTGEANIKFYKSPLAVTDNDNTFDSVREKDLPLFLKIDIEGGEYPFFEQVDLSRYANVTGIVCEFHHLDNQKVLARFKTVIAKLRNYFDIVHVHGNNYAPLLDFDGYLFPKTPEISFVHKNICGYSAEYADITYPLVGLDFPNCKAREDLKFAVYK